MVFFCLITTAGYCQCADTFEVKSIQKATENGNDGKITLTIETARTFTCELQSYRNANRTVVYQRSGQGSSTIVFDKLNNTDFYRITFTVPDEQDPFCQSRVLDQIVLTGNKRKL